LSIQNKMNKNFLSEVAQKKKAHLERQKAALSIEELKQKITEIEYSHRSFKDALSKESKISLIAELKQASPSKGLLRRDFDPVTIANIYKIAGADAISILTEEDYFKGKASYIGQVREVVDLPILRKDFIIDEYQIYESRRLGADAILLITALLSQDELKNFLTISEALSLECLVEIHDEDDLNKALNTNAQIIGINNRNLKTLELDLTTAERLISRIPQEKILVCESGIKTKADILRMKKLNISAVLIGEVFLSADRQDISSEDIRTNAEEIIRWLK